MSLYLRQTAGELAPECSFICFGPAELMQASDPSPFRTIFLILVSFFASSWIIHPADRHIYSRA